MAEMVVETKDFYEPFVQIEVAKTASMVISLPVVDDVGAPVDLTSWTVTFGVYDQVEEEGATSNLLVAATITGTADRTATFTPANHATMGVGSHFWRFDITAPSSGPTTRVSHGPYVVKG